MKTTAQKVGKTSIAIACLAAFTVSTGYAQTTATTEPVGFMTLSIKGGADNFMSVPMTRDAVFAGTVNTTVGTGGGAVTTNSFYALAGTVSPAWGVNTYVYANPGARENYYVEFTSGALKGLYYKITANTANQLTLDTEGDNLTIHAVPGNATAALANGDSFRIRPYWRVKDVFENAGTPVIDSRPVPGFVKDDILFLDYTSVAINKSPLLTVFYVAGVGWRSSDAINPDADYSDYSLRPNEGFIVRRRNANDLNLTNLGGVLTNRAISFVPGGNGASQNDVYISINRPAAVSLTESGLRLADQTLSLIKDSANEGFRQDELWVFPAVTTGAGQNPSPTATYYYLAGVGVGQDGWRQVGDSETPVGASVFLQPGKVYMIRKKAPNGGRDWFNDANY